MKPNINDLSKFDELRSVLAIGGVAAASINTIERALKKGMVFRRAEDVGILNIAGLDLRLS